jgi:hypothetical protein
MEDISEKLGHVRVGRLKLAGLRTSGTCLFAPNNEGGKLKGDGPLISLAVKCGIAVLQDPSSGWSASIRIDRGDRRGSANFQWY